MKRLGTTSLVLTLACGGNQASNATSGGGTSGGGGRSEGGGSAVSSAGSHAVLVPSLPPRPPEVAPPDCANDEHTRHIEADVGAIRDIVISAEGDVIVIAGAHSETTADTLWLWRVSPAEPEKLLESKSARARTVSASGSTVLGEDAAGDFLWREGAVLRLPFDRQPSDCTPRLSRDGSSVVGCLARQTVLVQGETTTSIDPPPGSDASAPLAINANGAVIAGVAYTADETGEATDVRAMIWTAAGGTRVLPSPPGYDRARAVGISEDGRRAVVLGRKVGVSSDETGAFRWSDGGKLEYLGRWTDAFATPDANTVVGTAEGSLWWWRASNDAIEYANDDHRTNAILQLSLSGERALVRQRSAHSEGTVVWDALLGWLRYGGWAMSENGRFLVVAGHCSERRVIRRVDLDWYYPFVPFR